MPIELQIFTTRYSADQDRLCIDGQTVDGEIVRLWLTCRLLRKLLPPLLQLITPVAETEDKSNILAEWVLTNAQAQQSTEKGVERPIPNSPHVQTFSPESWLVRSVELKSSPHRAVLDFCILDDCKIATVSLKPEHLRQWLGIVYRLWIRAGWPENEWPGWMVGAVIPSTPAHVVLQ